MRCPCGGPLQPGVDHGDTDTGDPICEDCGRRQREERAVTVELPTPRDERPPFPEPDDVIYGQLVMWPLPTQQVVDDVIAALAEVGYRISRAPDEETVALAERAPTWEQMGATIEEWDAYGSIITLPGVDAEVWIDRRTDGYWTEFPKGYLIRFGDGERTWMSDEDARRAAAALIDGSDQP